MRKNLLRVLATGVLLAAAYGAANAADWRIAVPTESGLGIIEPNVPGAASIQLLGREFGQIDEILPTDSGARLLAGIGAIASGSETIMAYDTRIMAPTGTTSFGGSMYGIIPKLTHILPDGKTVIVVSFDGNLNAIDMTTGKAIGKPIPTDSAPFGSAIAADGTLYVGMKAEGEKDILLKVAIATTNPMALTKTVTVGKEKFSDDEVTYGFQLAGNTAAVFAPKSAYLMDTKSGKVRKVSPVYNKKALTPIGLGADGRTLLCRYGDGATGIFVTDATTGKVTKRVLMKDPAYAVGSGDGSLIYVSSPAKSTVGVFDAKTMEPVRSYPVEGLLGPIRVLGQPDTAAPPVPKTIRGNVVIVGDSVLGGAADAKETYATALQKRLAADGYGIPVINNCSADGVSTDLAEGFADVLEYNAKVVVVCMGTADLAAAQAEAEAELPEDATKETKAAAVAAAQAKAAPLVGPALDKALEQAKAAGMKTVLVAPANELLKPVYEAAAAKHGVPMVQGGKSFKDSLEPSYPLVSGIVAELAK